MISFLVMLFVSYERATALSMHSVEGTSGHGGTFNFLWLDLEKLPPTPRYYATAHYQSLIIPLKLRKSLLQQLTFGFGICLFFSFRGYDLGWGVLNKAVVVEFF